MAYWAKFEKVILHKYIKWHNCEHMAERVSIPGFQNVRRYVVEQLTSIPGSDVFLKFEIDGY